MDLRLRLRRALIRAQPVTRLLDPEEAGAYLRRRQQEPRVASAREAFERYRSNTDEVRVHVGSGGRILRGWLNIDHQFVPEFLERMDTYPAEERGDLDRDFVLVDAVQDGLPFPDDSVDVIFHEDFIEHLNQRDVVGFLADARRVMKPGAVQRISTPDLVWSMHQWSSFTRGASGVYYDEWDRWNHKNVFTARYLEDVCEMVGYSRIERRARNESSDPSMARDSRPDVDRPSDDANLYYEVYK